jgi:hypothetical protein
LLSLNSCYIDLCHDTIGRGELVTEERQVNSFYEVDMKIAGNVYFTQGSAQALVIEAQENILNILRTRVINGRLEIYFTDYVRQYEDINIYITYPQIEKFILSGAGSIVASNTVVCNHIEFLITGAGDIEFNRLSAESIESVIPGAGNIYLAGDEVVFDHFIEISGAGNLHSYDLPVENVEIYTSGMGNCKVHAILNLDVSISGVGNVYYIGDPTVSLSNSGVGNLIHVD